MSFADTIKGLIFKKQPDAPAIAAAPMPWTAGRAQG